MRYLNCTFHTSAKMADNNGDNDLNNFDNINDINLPEDDNN